MKRRLFALALALLVALAAELLSFAALSLSLGELASPDRLAAERRRSDAGQSAGPAELAGIPFPRRHQEEQALHPFLGFVMDAERHPAARRPNLNAEAAELGFPWNTEPLLQRRSAERVLIGVFGGSVAAILAGQNRDLLLAELTKIPRFAGRRITLLNLAAFGYKQPQQLAALAYLFALGAELDVVINLDGFNDVALAPADLEPRGVFYAFPQSWFARVAPLDPEVRALQGELAFVQRERAASAAHFSRRPWRWSFTAQLLWRLGDRHRAGAIAAVEARLNAWQPEALGFAARGPERRFPSREALVAELAALWARSSREMHALAVGHGAAYVHLLQPNQYLAGSKPLGEAERKLAFDPRHPYRPGVEAGYPLLRATGEKLREEGIAFYDLTQIFSTLTEPLYEDTCCHLNRRGNELLARAVAEALDNPIN